MNHRESGVEVKRVGWNWYTFRVWCSQGMTIGHGTRRAVQLAVRQALLEAGGENFGRSGW